MNFAIAQLDEISPTKCPCGWARRAFASLAHAPASVHLVEISEDARAHYHRTMTEIYVVLEGEGLIELDGIPHAVKPMSAITESTSRYVSSFVRLSKMVAPVTQTSPWISFISLYVSSSISPESTPSLSCFIE